MDRKFGIIVKDHAYLRGEPEKNSGCSLSSIEDEVFSGWTIRILPETSECGWAKVRTHYGYEGFLAENDFRVIEKGELENRQDKTRYFRVNIGNADLLDCPKVQGLPQELLFKNALVELLEHEKEGWSRVRTASGKEGFVHSKYLSSREDDDGYLLKEEADYFIRKAKECKMAEDDFREKVIKNAKAYLGVQYRWGGKSAQGIDCSGLAFNSYMENGILIYRDAHMEPRYPIHQIDRKDLKKGDLIFFPGHVAIYLGDGKYIHSTAYLQTPCVTVNSLRPEDQDYRADLVEKICACGSLF